MARNEDIERMTAEWRRRHDEMERGTTYLERGRGQSRPRAEIRAAKSPVPQTFATALGAEVDPMEEAKKAYRAAANGEVDMPLVSPGVARVIGTGLAGYQGVEAAAGATGGGSQKYDVYGKRVFPIEGANARPVYDASRLAAAGYLSERSGRPVSLENLGRGLPEQVRNSDVFASMSRRQFNRALTAARDVVATYNLTKHLQDKVKQGTVTAVEKNLLQSLPSLDSRTLPGFFRGVMSDALKDNLKSGGENFPSLSLGNRVAPTVLGYGGGRLTGSPARNLAVFFRQATIPIEPESGGILTSADSFSPSHDTAVASHVALGKSLKQLVRDWYLSPDADAFREAFALTDDPNSALGIQRKSGTYNGLTARAIQNSRPELKVIGRLPYHKQTISGAFIPSDMDALSPQEAADLREAFNSAGIPFAESKSGRYGLPKAQAFGRSGPGALDETDQALMLLLSDGAPNYLPRSFDPTTPGSAQPVATTEAETKSAAYTLLDNLMLEPRELYGHNPTKRDAAIKRLTEYLGASAAENIRREAIEASGHGIQGVGFEDIDPAYERMVQELNANPPRVGSPVFDASDVPEPLDIPFALKAGRTRRDVRAAEGGGDTPGASETVVSETPVSEAPRQEGGPRIVINPQVFKDRRDALCVAFNEAFRVVMEMNGFEPVSEPTEKQRKFFSDTAYADNELQLRRTILARIATLDTSVKDPTDEQLEETMEMLEMVMEVGAPQNEWEQSAVQRLHDVVARSLESTRANGGGAPQPEAAEPEAAEPEAAEPEAAEPEAPEIPVAP